MNAEERADYNAKLCAQTALGAGILHADSAMPFTVLGEDDPTRRRYALARDILMKLLECRTAEFIEFCRAHYAENPATEDGFNWQLPEAVAQLAVQQADALLAELTKKPA